MRAMVLGLVAAALAGAAVAESDCGHLSPRADWIQALKGTYGESRIGVGLSHRGTLIELFASPTGSFTILESTVAGCSRGRTVGEGWTELPPAPEGDPL